MWVRVLGVQSGAGGWWWHFQRREGVRSLEVYLHSSQDPTSRSLAPGVMGCIPTMWCCLTHHRPKTLR